MAGGLRCGCKGMLIMEQEPTPQEYAAIDAHLVRKRGVAIKVPLKMSQEDGKLLLGLYVVLQHPWPLKYITPRLCRDEFSSCSATRAGGWIVSPFHCFSASSIGPPCRPSKHTETCR
jgi:hypothetical protein